MASCSPTRDPRRSFWTTQPAACGVESDSCASCGEVGLTLNCGAGGGATFATNDYVRGLALNILLTDGQSPSSECGFPPGSRGGYWADSFRTDNENSGSRFRFADATGSMSQQIALLKSFAQKDLDKLVTYGVVASVKVDIAYRGGNRASMSVVFVGRDGTSSNLGLVGGRLKNGWVWSETA